MKVLGFIGVLLVVILFMAWGALFGAWILMLLLGAFSHVANIPQAALGYWACFIIVLILEGFTGGAVRASK